MRRNRIISDIFNRLNYMERRGSGLVRILSSYDDCDIKPIFSSNNSSFTVTFPNKGYINSSKENVSSNINNDNNNIVSDEDYFLIKLHKYLPDTFRKSTY